MNNDQKVLNSFLKAQIKNHQPYLYGTIKDNRVEIKRNDSNPPIKKIQYQRSKKNLLAFDYDDVWENTFIKDLKREVQQTNLKMSQNLKGIDYQGDSRGRQIKTTILQNNPLKYNKKKQYEKFKAYAVKMKIPAFHETLRYKDRQELKNDLFKDRPQSNNFSKGFNNSAFSSNIVSNIRFGMNSVINSMNGKIEQTELTYPNRTQNNHTKDYEQESKNLTDLAQIYKRKMIKNNSKLHSRKPSVKKQKQQTYTLKISEKDQMKSSNSPQSSKIYKLTYEQFTSNKATHNLQQKDEVNNSSNSIGKGQNVPFQPSTNIIYDKKIKEVRKNIKQNLIKASPNKEINTSISKSSYQDSYLEKMDIAIHFKKKNSNKFQRKDQSIVKKNRQNTEIQEEDKKIRREELEDVSKSPKSPEFERKSPSKALPRTIYTSKDVIRAKTSKGLHHQNTDDPRFLSKQFQKSKKFDERSKIIIFNSEDKYIKRILCTKQWIINPDYKSKFYHLKWMFKPNPEDYHEIKEGQYINHIKNSHQLTSKNCLNNNLKNYINNWPNLYKQYPKCYDLSKGIEKSEFYEQFIKQFMMILLQNCFHYLLETKKDVVEGYLIFYESNMEGNQYNHVNKKLSVFKKKNFRRINMENYKNYDQNCLIHMNLITLSLKYWRNMRKSQQLQFDEDYHFLKFNKKQFEDHLMHLDKYSKMYTPAFFKNTETYFQKEYYATPSDITLQRIVKEYVYFKHCLGYEWSVYGKKNIWIIKPCAASRGNGIYLENNCNDILSNKKGIQSKLVQKYIQRPLIFNNPKYPQILNKKFDIRQWVLLRSVQPLEIYMFSYCYVRLCPEQYNINNINNLQSHLTNYSCNKAHFKNTKQSVMDYDTFKSILLEERGIDYENIIKPKIKDIIVKSIKSGQHLLKDYNQKCFSLLGYDILLDNYCQPWLLEINMSPACQQRTQWLKIYLEQMAKGLMKIILPQSYFNIDPKEPQIFDKQSKITIKDPIMAGSQKKEFKILEKEENRQFLQNMKTQNSQLCYQMPPIFQQNKQKEQNNFPSQQNLKSPFSKFDYIKFEQEQMPEQKEEQFDEQQQINYTQFIKIHQDNIQEYGQGQQNDGNRQNQEDSLSQSWQEVHFGQFQTQKGENMGTPSESPMLSHTQLKQPENHLICPKKQIKIEGNHLQKSRYLLQSQLITQQNKSKGKICDKTSILKNVSIKNLYWELICFEQYPANKKQIQHLQVIGIKMNTNYLMDQDNMFNYFQKINTKYLKKEASIKSIGNYLLSFLKYIKMDKMNQDEKSDQDRKNIFNKGKHNKHIQKRQVKSSLQIQEQKKDYTTKNNFSVIQVAVSNENSLKLASKIKKDGKNTSFRQKIRTFVSSTLQNRQPSDIQEIVLSNKHVKTKTMKEKQYEKKRGFSQNYII